MSDNQEVEIEQVEEVDLSTCTHHWIIEPAEGTVSVGRCKICKIDKDFYNSFERDFNGVKSHD